MLSTWGGCHVREGRVGFACGAMGRVSWRPLEIRSVKECGSISNLQDGHVVFRASQGRRQCLWKRCLPLHGNATLLSASKGNGSRVKIASTRDASTVSGDLLTRSSLQIAQPSTSSPSVDLSFSYRRTKSSGMTSIALINVSARSESLSAPAAESRLVMSTTQSGGGPRRTSISGMRTLC